MIVRLMRKHELGFLLGDYIKEVMVFWGDEFSNKLPLIHWKWLGVEGGSWGRIVSNGSKLSCVLGQAYQPVAEGKCQDTDFSENDELKLEERLLETFPRIR